MATQIGSYKGKPTISLNAESKWPFTFGVPKAKLIVENIEAIKAFVASNGGSAPAAPDRFDIEVEDRMAEAAGVDGYGR